MLAHRIGADWNVGDEYAARARVSGSRQCVFARGENRIQVAEENYRNPETRPLDEGESAVVGHSFFECLLRARLDDRSVGNRIRERYAELDDVGPTLLERAERRQRALEVRMARRHVADERST